jgi:1-acyl-sn-glycerol-3-phosphate acyltransferase
MRKFLAKIFFNVSWIFCRLFFSFFLHYKIENKEHLRKLEPPLLVISNHTSFIDPYLVSAAFPFNSKIFPIRFAVAPRFYKSPVFFPFIWCYGGFPVYKKIGLEKSLKTPLKILEKGEVVGIFPEGKIRRRGRPRKGRRGAAFLAIRTGVPLMSVRIEGATGLTFSRFLSRKIKITIVLGKKFYLPLEFMKSENIDGATEFIMKNLKNLKL